MTTTIEITENAKPAMERLKLKLRNDATNPVIGHAVVKLLKQRFLAKPRNWRGFPTTHFWPRAAAATTFQADGESVRISVNQIGVMQRFLGGSIIPTRAKFLTIPAIAEAYGHRAGDFSGLKVARGDFEMYHGRRVSLALVAPDWKPNLDDPADTTGVYFWLVRAVSQQPDPTVLPDENEITWTALAAIKGSLK